MTNVSRSDPVFYAAGLCFFSFMIDGITVCATGSMLCVLSACCYSVLFIGYFIVKLQC